MGRSGQSATVRWNRGSNPAGSVLVQPTCRNWSNFVRPTLPVFRKRRHKPLVPSIWCLCQGT